MPVTKATPNRKTRLRFNSFLPSVVSSAVFFSRDANEMGRGERARTTNCALVKDVGWRLRRHSDPGDHWERTVGQTPTPGTVPSSGFLTFYANRKPTLDGVTYSGRPDQSQSMYLKQVPAGDSWESRLAEDQTSYPGITADDFDPITTMDRVFVADAVHEPDDAVSFVFAMQSPVTGASGIYACAYFSGPAGIDGVLEGIGQYCLGLVGGGIAYLYERGKEPGESDWVWRLRHRFNVGVPKHTDAVRFTVTSDCSNGCDGSWKGRKLSFKTENITHAAMTGFRVVETMIAGAITALESDLAKTHTYWAPNSKNRAATPCPVRIDARRDIRLAFQAFDSEYPESGTIVDQPFPIGVLATPDEPITIDLYGDRPTGTDIEMRLYADDGDNAGTELVGTLLIDDCLGKRYSFAIPEGFPLTTLFHAEFDLTGPTTKTPTLQGYVIQRAEITEAADDSAVYDFPLREASGTALPMRVIEQVSVQGLSSNPEAESATVSVADLAATLTEARTRTGTPIDIEILDDNGDHVTNLFHGIIATVGSSALPGKANRFPQPGAWRGDFAIVSEMARLNRRLAPTRISLWDMTAGKPLKVTDALKVLLKYAGYSAAYVVAIPDLSIRISGSDQESTMIEPDTPLGDICSRLVFDYLGGLFFFDKNAGDNGSWRVLIWPRQPYNTVLRFDPGHPGANKLKHVIGAYGSTTASNGQVIQHLPMFGPTVLGYEPPEGNMVIVIGGSTEGVGGSQLAQMAVNVDSFNALNLADSHDNYPDFSHPDFLRDCVPIVVRDVSINTPDAINFVTRRYYDAGCCAKETIKFNSLLPLFTDVTDEFQSVVRAPRVGDMVQVKQSNGSWKDYIVANCNPRYSRAHMMRADFEIVSTSRMAEIAVAIGGLNSASYLGKVAEHFRASIGVANGRFVSIGNAPGSGMPRVNVAGLPAITVPPIQDLDPESATFGQFHFMAGYDPLP